MAAERKTFVEFNYPGVLFPESSTREVAYREVPPAGKIHTLTDEPFNYSPRFFYGGIVYTVDELKAKFPGDEHRILISNVEGNGYSRAIQTPLGNWQHMEDGDIVLQKPEPQPR